MSIFRYIAKDLAGEYHRGEVETSTETQVVNLLRRKRLIVLSVKSKGGGEQSFLEKYLSRVTFGEVVVMTRQLATMIGAGLILSEAMDILSEQQTNKRFKKVLEAISTDIKGGLDFASAVEQYPDVFPHLYGKLIRAGQSSGKLDTILLELANNLEKEREFKSRVKGAMIYPMVVISMMIGVMMIMVFFVMPKLLGLYKDSNLELPLPTRVVLGVAEFMINFWWVVAMAIVILVIVAKRYIATPDGRLNFDRLILRTPILGHVVTLVILTNFTRTFALLIAAGISILEAIKIVSNVVGNRVYKDGLNLSYAGVERGLPLSNQLLGLSFFPRIVGQMIKTGEETGKLDEIIFKLSDYFESESDHALKNITTLIEPIVLVILGIGVAFLVISIILPIYQLTTNIK